MTENFKIENILAVDHKYKKLSAYVHFFTQKLYKWNEYSKKIISRFLKFLENAFGHFSSGERTGGQKFTKLYKLVEKRKMTILWKNNFNTAFSFYVIFQQTCNLRILAVYAYWRKDYFLQQIFTFNITYCC